MFSFTTIILNNSRNTTLTVTLLSGSMPRPYYANSKQPALASCSAASYFQDQCPCDELFSWHSSGIPTGVLHPSVKYQRSFTLTVCIEWMNLDIGNQVNQTAQFCRLTVWDSLPLAFHT